MAVEDAAERELPQRTAGLDVAVHPLREEVGRLLADGVGVCEHLLGFGAAGGLGRGAVDVLDHLEHDALLRAEAGVHHDGDAPLLAGGPVRAPSTRRTAAAGPGASCSAARRWRRSRGRRSSGSRRPRRRCRRTGRPRRSAGTGRWRSRRCRPPSGSTPGAGLPRLERVLRLVPLWNRSPRRESPWKTNSAATPSRSMSARRSTGSCRPCHPVRWISRCSSRERAPPSSHRALAIATG